MVIVVRVAREKRSWAEDRSKIDKVRGVGVAVFVQGEQVDCSGAGCAFFGISSIPCQIFFSKRKVVPSIQQRWHKQHISIYITTIFYDSLVFHLQFSFKAESLKNIALEFTTLNHFN